MADDPKVLRGAEAIAEFQRQLGLLSAGSRERGEPPPPELCDHCGEVVTERRMICASLKSHKADETGAAVQARVNTQRWWRFCGEACAHEWYATETDEHFMETGPAPAPAPCDGHSEGEHDFPDAPTDGAPGPAIVVQNGRYRIEHADGRVEEGDYVPGMALPTGAPPVVCSRCERSAADVMPCAPHLIDEGEQQDRLLRLVAVHVVPGNPPTLLDHQIFDEPAHLNEYWKTAGAPAPLGLRGERPGEAEAAPEAPKRER
jgi:hypothetical protein